MIITTQSKLQQLIALTKAKKAAELAKYSPMQQPTQVAVAVAVATALPNTEEPIPEGSHAGVDRYGKPIYWNKEQWEFICNATNGKSAVLIGAAGTGKTTTMRGSIEELIRNKHFPPMYDEHKHLPSNTPGIVAISYTRRAVMNLKRAMPPEIVDNCITIHKLLEYAPVFYEVTDPATGKTKNTMVFEPTRNRHRKLSPNIKTIIIDESSMVSVALFHQIWMALPDPSTVQFIFLGDIQQLPPVFGSAILGYKLLQLPVVELTQVYRQALESPIIKLAHRILSGIPIPVEEYDAWYVPGKLKLHAWKKSISADNALLTIAKFFKLAYDAGSYNHEENMILIPFNKACGTDELNKHIANHIARKEKRVTFEVIAGFNKHYFSVGDKVLYDKEDAFVIDIKRNPTYSGVWPQEPSHLLDYWGAVQTDPELEGEHHLTSRDNEPQDIDDMLALMSSELGESEERVREASHIITVKLDSDGREIEVKTAAAINSTILSYALTVHKSQGSEWRKVYLMLHKSHNTMLQRELLYTAVTRAREDLYVICEPDSFTKGITGQRIKGNTLEEKALHFKGKLDNGEDALIATLV